jgi:Delta3-Delta2-enoyl-CoA isomerase
MSSLLRAKLAPHVQRKVLLEAHKYTAIAAQVDGIVNAAVQPDRMLEVAVEWAERWKTKARIGVHGVLRRGLVGEAVKAYQKISYVHSRKTTVEPKVRL